MNKMTNYINRNLFSVITFMIMTGFYLFFALYDGPVIAVDSPTYIDMSFSREPFYPLLLAFFRLFSPDRYLLYVVIFQSLLMAVSSWLLADLIIKKFKLPQWYGCLLYFIPIAVSLLNRFIAKRSSMYTNNILTEGICTSLYLLFIYFLLSYIFYPSGKKLIAAWIIMFFMFSSRKQMLMTLPIFAFILFYDSFLKKKLKKGLITIVLSSLLLISSFYLFDCTYNYVLRGSFEGHSSSNRFITTLVFYNASSSDAEYIRDSHVKELFLKIYNTCEKNGYTASHAKDTWLDRVNHFGDHYDHIQIDTMWPMILEDARESVDQMNKDLHLSDKELIPLYDKKTDEINSMIIRSILPHQLPKLITLLFDNFLSGIIITVSQLRFVFIPYTIIIFIIYFYFTFLLMKKNSSLSMHEEDYLINRACILLSAITLIGIFTNTFIVSSVIFCQTRYMIYNMPLFYMTLCVLFFQTIRLTFKNKV